MPKSYEQSAEKSSTFLSPTSAEGERAKRGRRDSTRPMREARFINIDRIRPDPDQPRKAFRQETLESLAESIRELGEIIDPLTVEYDEQMDFFRIISGERRYRAAEMTGLEKLPCITKEVDEKTRLLLQLVANLQRENITPLEESGGIKLLMEKFGYSQVAAGKILNKSESYISQILGLQRLTQSSREILQTSEVAKEIQIKASKEKEPGKQEDILKKASEEKMTVREIRADGKKNGSIMTAASCGAPKPEERFGETTVKSKTFSRWSWKPDNGKFEITIRFRQNQNKSEKLHQVKRALEEAHRFVTNRTNAIRDGENYGDH